MKASGVDWERVHDRGIPLPEYDWPRGSPEEFHRAFVERPHPVVLRGFMRNSKLTREYTFDKGGVV